MLYRRVSPTVSPTTQDRAPHVRRLSAAYDLSAMRRNDAAIDSAGYDVTFYRQLVSGLPCTCHNDPELQVLNDEGNMDPNIINQLTMDIPTDIGHDRAIEIVDYESDRTLTPYIDSRTKFLEYLREGRLEPDYEPKNDVEEALLEQEHEDRDDDTAVEISSDRALSAFSSNCPVCGRTGIVGGYSVIGGYRRIIDSQQFRDLHLCEVDHTKSPHCIASGVDGDTDDFSIIVTPSLILPKHPYKIESLRIFNGYNPVWIYGKDSDDVFCYIIDDDAINGRKKLSRKEPGSCDLETYCDGEKYQLEIHFRNCSITHLELQIRLRSKPVRLDLGNYSRAFSPKSVNDVDPIQIAVPSYMGRVSRGDLFYERTSGLLWILTGVEGIRSADNWIGYSGTASRVRTRFEPYTLHNPYQGTNVAGIRV